MVNELSVRILDYEGEGESLTGVDVLLGDRVQMGMFLQEFNSERGQCWFPWLFFLNEVWDVGTGMGNLVQFFRTFYLNALCVFSCFLKNYFTDIWSRHKWSLVSILSVLATWHLNQGLPDINVFYFTRD